MLTWRGFRSNQTLLFSSCFHWTCNFSPLKGFLLISPYLFVWFWFPPPKKGKVFELSSLVEAYSLVALCFEGLRGALLLQSANSNRSAQLDSNYPTLVEWIGITLPSWVSQQWWEWQSETQVGFLKSLRSAWFPPLFTLCDLFWLPSLELSSFLRWDIRSHCGAW